MHSPGGIRHGSKAFLMILLFVAAACSNGDMGAQGPGGQPTLDPCEEPDGVVRHLETPEAEAFLESQGFKEGEIQRLAAAPSEGPIYVFDLTRYSQDVQPLDISEHIAAVGGEVVFQTEVDRQIDGDDIAWHSVSVMEYPCAAADLAMLADPEFQAHAFEASERVEEAITLVTRLRPLPAPGDPLQAGAQFPPTAEDPSFDLIHVMDFHDIAQYDPGVDEPERTGLEAWEQYQAGGRGASSELGHYPTAILDVEGVLVGDDRSWDQAQIIHMSSLEGFQALLDDSTRRAGRYHRYAALEHNYSIIAFPSVSQIPYAFWGLSLPILALGAASALALLIGAVWMSLRGVRRRRGHVGRPGLARE